MTRVILIFPTTTTCLKNSAADGGPRIAMWLVNGILCNGGPKQQYGWGWWPVSLSNIAGNCHGTSSRTSRGTNQTVIDIKQSAFQRLLWYSRALKVSEAVAIFRAEGVDL